MPPTDLSQLDLGAELERRVADLWWSLMREDHTDLSRTSASVLARLKGEGPQRVTNLANSEHVAQPSMSLLLQRLVKRGLVERLTDPADRRASRIAITPEGEAILRLRAESRSNWLRRRLDRLEQEDRSALMHAMTLLDRMLEDGAGG